MYDRGNVNQEFDLQFTRTGDRAQESALLLSRVCFLTIAALAFTAFGSAITWAIPLPGLWLVGLIGSFVMLFVCQAVAHKFPVNLVALATFATLEGVLLGPLLARYAAAQGGTLIIAQAALLSIVIFAMVGTLGYTSTRSYAHWMPWLIGGLFVLIIAGIVLWFVSSPAANWLYCVGGALLFVAFIFVDFTRIRHNFGADEYIAATMMVYLDLINLFLFLLRLLSRRD